MRIAAVADLHCCHRRPELLADRLASVDGLADVLVCAGDLTEAGTPREARALVAALRTLPERLPCVTVLGNHDCEQDAGAEIRGILEEAHWIVLDGEAVRFGDLGIAGGKGFGGGFGRRRVMAFGEPAIKRFVGEATAEIHRIEEAARRLQTPRRVIVTHYAPVASTLIGEAPEVLPFLGNSELAAVADRAGMDVYVHGHAHFGRAEGRTPGGVTVFNVALPVLDALHPPLRFRLFELAGVLGPPEPLPP